MLSPTLRTLLVLLGAAAFCSPAVATTTYRVDATLSHDPPQIDGTVEIHFTNTSRAVLHEAVLLLFPQRFAEPDIDIDDFSRPFIYPEQEFDPAGMQVDLLEPATAPIPLPVSGLPSGCALRVPIPDTPPAAVQSIRLRFHTRIPHRFGGFGEFEGQVTLNGGWYPFLPPLADDGSWQTDAAPPVADLLVTLNLPPDHDVILNGERFAHGGNRVAGTYHGRWLSLVAAPQLQRTESTVDATTVTFLHRPHRFEHRISPEPDFDEQMRDTLLDIIRKRPPQLDELPTNINVVEAPLRLQLAQPSDGLILVSDRSLRVYWLLRPFHEMQLAQAVYAELLRPLLLEREAPGDVDWVSEGLSRLLAARYMDQARPATRSVQDWIDLFNIFAIVDRFETAPKIPFVDSFFERSQRVDPRHEQLPTFAGSRPPGHVIFAKLQHQLGDECFRRVVDACLAARTAFRSCAAQQSGVDLADFFAQWLQPFPQLNYRFAAMRLNQQAEAGYRQDVELQRDSNRTINEPVDVRLRSVGGQPVDLRWDGHGPHGTLTVTTPQAVEAVELDPDRKLIETTRVDNRQPRELQFVLDTAEVEISSTEFGFAALAVARSRYDYRKDLAVAGVYSNRGAGVDLGPRMHFGPAIDANSYRHNLYGFYSLGALDSGYHDKRHPQERTAGHVNGIGVRYNYTDVYAFDNPTRSHDLRLFADWYDRAVGSDYNYVDWGASLVVTRPLFTPRTVVAVEITNSFSEPLGSSVVPLQGRYSLGGSRSIRGIGAEEQIGRNLFLVRTELRRSIYPEIDHNFLDALVARRFQAHAFVDTGQVSNSAGAVYDPHGYAVGVGIGVGLVYEFLGFFPSLAYIEIATRVDRSDKIDDVQFLFGTRQPF